MTSSNSFSILKLYLATAEQLNAIGWSGVTDSMVSELNSVLYKHNITTIERIRHFLAQCAHESDYGKGLTERYDPPEFEYFENKYGKNTDKGKELGNTEDGDGSKFRGAGYIHLTGRYNYQKFADDMNDQKIVEEGYTYLKDNYAWEAAGWYWTGHNMNNYIKDVYSLETVEVLRDIINKYEDDKALKSRQEAYNKTSKYIK